MKRVVLAGVLVVAISVAGCSNPRGQSESAAEIPLPQGIPLCDEIFAPNAIVDPATFGDGCRTAEDELRVPRPAVLNCEDGGQLLWNDIAWGYKGQPMRLWPPEEPEKVPMDAAMNCLRRAATSTTTASRPSTTADEN